MTLQGFRNKDNIKDRENETYRSLQPRHSVRIERWEIYTEDGLAVEASSHFLVVQSVYDVQNFPKVVTVLWVEDSPSVVALATLWLCRISHLLRLFMISRRGCQLCLPCRLSPCSRLRRGRCVVVGWSGACRRLILKPETVFFGLPLGLASRCDSHRELVYLAILFCTWCLCKEGTSLIYL